LQNGIIFYSFVCVVLNLANQELRSNKFEVA
jgi:hypothetical protein